MKEHRYDDYGIDGLDLLGARVLVEEALGIELEERESGYYAGNYFCLRTGGTRPLMLYSNFDESSKLMDPAPPSTYAVDQDALAGVEAIDANGRSRHDRQVDGVILTDLGHCILRMLDEPVSFGL